MVFSFLMTSMIRQPSVLPCGVGISHLVETCIFASLLDRAALDVALLSPLGLVLILKTACLLVWNVCLSRSFTLAVVNCLACTLPCLVYARLRKIAQGRY